MHPVQMLQDALSKTIPTWAAVINRACKDVQPVAPPCSTSLWPQQQAEAETQEQAASAHADPRDGTSHRASIEADLQNSTRGFTSDWGAEQESHTHGRASSTGRLVHDRQVDCQKAAAPRTEQRNVTARALPPGHTPLPHCHPATRASTTHAQASSRSKHTSGNVGSGMPDWSGSIASANPQQNGTMQATAATEQGTPNESHINTPAASLAAAADVEPAVSLEWDSNLSSQEATGVSRAAWDLDLHARLELPESERVQITARLDGWAQQLLRVGPALMPR